LVLLAHALADNISSEYAKKCCNFDVELHANAQELEYQTSIILQLYILFTLHSAVCGAL